MDRRPVEDSEALDAGCALLAKIGTLTQLCMLTLREMFALDVRDCCRHLAPLIHLQHLRLERLPVHEHTSPAAALDADVPPAGQAGESSFRFLLAGMPQLQTLVLSGVGLSGCDATRVFSAVIPTLADICTLDVRANSLAAAPLKAPAQSCRQLPRLQRVFCDYFGGQDDLNPDKLAVTEAVEELNRAHPDRWQWTPCKGAPNWEPPAYADSPPYFY